MRLIWLIADIPASQPPRCISSESHINGSRTHGVADAPQTFDHSEGTCIVTTLRRFSAEIKQLGLEAGTLTQYLTYGFSKQATK